MTNTNTKPAPTPYAEFSPADLELEVAGLRELLSSTLRALDNWPGSHIFADVADDVDLAVLALTDDEPNPVLAGNLLCEAASTLPSMTEDDPTVGERFFGFLSHAVAAKFDTLGVALGGTSRITEHRGQVFGAFRFTPEEQNLAGLQPDEVDEVRERIAAGGQLFAGAPADAHEAEIATQRWAARRKFVMDRAADLKAAA